MIDTRLRSSIQPVFNVIGRALVKLNLTPNKITVIALITGVISGMLIGYQQFILAFVFLWISGLFDVLDGTVARITSQSSKLGAYMDLIFDRLVEAGIVLGFFFAFPEYALTYLLFFIAVIFNFTTFMVAAALFTNNGEKSMHYDVGIAERTETFIAFSLMMLFTNYSNIILLIFNGIIVLTGVIRFYRVIKYTKDQGV